MQKEGNLMNDNLYVKNNSQFTAHCSLKRAFTLAEVLITLGIIGVVAVLTLPNLMSDYRKKTYVAQLQRVYNQIQTAAENCMVDEDVDDLNDTYLRFNNNYYSDINRDDYDSSDAYYEAVNESYNNAYLSSSGRFLKKYFRVTKDCGVTERDGECRSRGYKDIRGSYVEPDADFRGLYCVNINTGATICMGGFGSWNPNVATIWLDTNGSAGPNTWGRDIFEFYIDGKGDIVDVLGAGEFIGSGYSRTCVNKIMSDGWKMDY